MTIKFLTAESVCKGHPDKLCDTISDSILDECILKDKSSRVACEVMATGNKIIVSGEITCSQKIDIEAIVKKVLLEIGYDPSSFTIYVFVNKQSVDIKEGVDNALEARNGDSNDLHSLIGAGDQGSMYGYATDESSDKLPLPLVFAHAICKRLDMARKEGVIKEIGPDGKAQVTVEYENGLPKRIKTIVISIQHSKDKSQQELRDEVIKKVIDPVFIELPYDKDTEILINPSGRFIIGGPEGDTGLTGRKIMVDTYGGLAAHGGGAFSGKDPTKVDRSAAYMARAVSKNIVLCGYAKKCQTAISYAIGKAKPVMVEVETFGTSSICEEVLRDAVNEVFDLRPSAIIESLDLRTPIYAKTAAYGHFGGNEFNWEKYNKCDELKSAVEKRLISEKV